jgi:hypothetical protein
MFYSHEFQPVLGYLRCIVLYCPKTISESASPLRKKSSKLNANLIKVLFYTKHYKNLICYFDIAIVINEWHRHRNRGGGAMWAMAPQTI